MKPNPSRSLFAACALALALVACGREPGAADVDAPSAGTPSSDQPAADVPPATVPPGTPMPSDMPEARNGDQAQTSPARFDGYGAARFGMSAGQVRNAWDGDLDGNPAEGDACFHLSPAGQPSIAYFALMFVDGEFARYSVANDAMTAPGGGRLGMTEAQIEALYPGRVERSGHKYVEGGHYLRIADDDGEGALVFETGADGTVTGWRVGLPPAVDYVEGCA